MKTLQELAIEKGAIALAVNCKGDKLLEITGTQLESLINEVISQRAGEPVAEINFYGKVPGIITHPIINQLQDGTKLYAIKHLLT
jgi:hypothetical protein